MSKTLTHDTVAALTSVSTTQVDHKGFAGLIWALCSINLLMLFFFKIPEEFWVIFVVVVLSKFFFFPIEKYTFFKIWKNLSTFWAPCVLTRSRRDNKVFLTIWRICSFNSVYVIPRKLTDWVGFSILLRFINQLIHVICVPMVPNSSWVYFHSMRMHTVLGCTPKL